MQVNDKIKIVNKDGVEQEYSILSTFDYKERKFIIYTDYSMDENKNIRVFSGIYEDDDRIFPITNENDEIVVSNFIKFLERGLKNNTLFN